MDGLSQIPHPGELEFSGGASPCSYLPLQTHQFRYRLALTLSAERYEQLLSRGWRRFGRTLFRPACELCTACRSLRVDVKKFEPTKSQRRCARRNSDIEFQVQPVGADEAAIDLYNRYHEDMAERRGWPLRIIDRHQYEESFTDGDFPFARQFRYFLGEKLVAVGIVDITERLISSIYFFHDPELRPRALGTSSVLSEIGYAAEHGIPWLYMGYWIQECGSMSYKNRFRPHQLLVGRPEDDTQPLWRTGSEG